MIPRSCGVGSGNCVNGRAAADAASPLSPTEALTAGFAAGSALHGVAAAARARAARQAAEQARQGFRIGELCLMVRYEDGSELTELPSVYSLPNAPAWFLGIANLHGVLIPVFDLARYLGLASASVTKPMLLVLAHGSSAAGMVIAGLPERLRWSDAQLADNATAPAQLSGVVQRSVLIGGQLWFDLDCGALLQAVEASLAS